MKVGGATSFVTMRTSFWSNAKFKGSDAVFDDFKSICNYFHGITFVAQFVLNNYTIYKGGVRRNCSCIGHFIC